MRTVLLLLLVTGCAAFEPKVEYVPYEVKVAVEVPCAAQVPPEPEWATKGMPRATAGWIDKATDTLLAERRQRMGYEQKLKAAVEGCR